MLFSQDSNNEVSGNVPMCQYLWIISRDATRPRILNVFEKKFINFSESKTNKKIKEKKKKLQKFPTIEMVYIKKVYCVLKCVVILLASYQTRCLLLKTDSS